MSITRHPLEFLAAAWRLGAETRGRTVHFPTLVFKTIVLKDAITLQEAAGFVPSRVRLPTAARVRMLRVSAGAGTSITRGVAALCSMDRKQAVVSPVVF